MIYTRVAVSMFTLILVITTFVFASVFVLIIAPIFSVYVYRYIITNYNRI